MKRKRIRRFDEITADYEKHDAVKKMKEFPHHGRTNTFEHCRRVAKTSYLLNRKLHLGADEEKMVRAAMLHDLFLYDWHDGKPERKRHGFTHPDAACENAMKYFALSEKEQHIIRCHMWPLTIRRLPKTREAWIVCLADKACALMETVQRKRK